MVYLLYYFFGRKPLFGFFGLTETREVFIYLSHLQIQQGGAIGADGLPRSFGGSAVPYLEVLSSSSVASLFNVSMPGRSIQPSWLSNILLADISLSLVPAPLPPELVIFPSTTIVVGSPAYSTASAAIQNDLHSPVHFNAQNSQIIVPGLPPVTNPLQAFIVRLPHQTHFVFYLGGLSEGGTAAALSYLARSWRALHRRYRHAPAFYILVEFVGQDYTNSHIVAEGQLNVA